MLQLYGLARCAFVGGSLVPVGGHNPIEPALFHLPVLTGPEQFNFADAYDQLLSLGGAIEVSDANTLADQVIEYLSDEAARRAAGRAAAEVVAANTGATDRTRQLLQELISHL